MVKAVEMKEDFEVQTLEGKMTGHAGDFLVIGVKGERYPVRKDIFEMTYELAGEEAITLSDLIDLIQAALMFVKYKMARQTDKTDKIYAEGQVYGYRQLLWAIKKGKVKTSIKEIKDMRLPEIPPGKIYFTQKPDIEGIIEAEVHPEGCKCVWCKEQ